MIWRHVGHVGVSALSRLCDSLNRTLCLSFLSVSQSFEISCDVFDLFCVSPDNFCSFCWRHFVLLTSSSYVHFHSVFLSCDRIPLWCKGIKILWNLTLCSQLSSASNLNRLSFELASFPGSLFFLSPRAEKHFAFFGQSLVSLWSWQKRERQKKSNSVSSPWRLPVLLRHVTRPNQARSPAPEKGKIWETLGKSSA